MNKYLAIFYVVMLLAMAVCVYNIHLEAEKSIKELEVIEVQDV